MNYSCFLNPSAVDDRFEPIGFKSFKDVTLYHDYAALKKSLKRSDWKTHRIGTVHYQKPKVSASQFRRAVCEFINLEKATLSKISSDDPAANMLRDFHPKLDTKLLGRDVLDVNTKFVNESSIQSTQSPAAYLKHIYDLALQIKAGKQSMSLSARRPDLSTFILSVENLNKEVATLTLANEVLVAQMISKGVAQNEDDLLRNFKTTRHPLSLPFDVDGASVRESLGAIDGLSLNIILDRGRPDTFASQQNYNKILLPDHRLRLYDEHASLLADSPDETQLYRDYYGLDDPSNGNDHLQYADNFCEATNITFNEFRQLVRNDVNVEDESGLFYSNIYSRFLSGGWNIKLVEDEDSRYKTEGQASSRKRKTKNSAVASFPHEIQNKCIRLQRRVGISFHHLDWLLMTALYGHPDYSISNEVLHREVLASGSGINLLAHYLEWSEKFQLPVDMYAAMLGDINCYRRLGSQEETLMRMMFGDNAPEVTLKTRRYNTQGHVTVGGIENEGFGDILRLGFQLSLYEWKAVLAEVFTLSSEKLDSAMMGRIYRLTKLFPLMGWTVVEGLTITRKYDPGLMEILGKSNSSDDVITAMDRIWWLSNWMKEVEFTPVKMVTLLTERSDAQVYVDQDVVNWIDEQKKDLAMNVVVATDFTPFTETGEKGIDEEGWMEELQEKDVIDTHGLVIVSEYDDIASAVGDVYKDLGHDPETNPEVVEKVAELSAGVDSRKVGQNNVIISQVTRKFDSISRESVPHVLQWMGSTIYEAERIVYDWDTANKPANVEGLQYLFDLGRHSMVTSTLKLEAPEVRLPSHHSNWISDSMESALSFHQTYLLERFKWLQNNNVSCNDWLAYFEKVQSEIDNNDGNPPKDQSQNHEILSKLLEWPSNDVSKLAEAHNGNAIGIRNACIATIQQADFISRRIQICKDASIGAAELAALETVGGSSFDWSDAASAAKQGLYRFENGSFASQAEGRVNEEKRDALVDNYLAKVASVDETLKDTVTNAETLYQYLLLDVKVSENVPTTRMLENIGCIQLYVSNMLSGFEDGSFEDRIAFREKWEVAQQYRIWEANEKLKLYPSIYIEPQLRLGKSEIFVQFERDISQSKLDQDTIDSAFYEYITSLQRLSELRCHGFFFTRNQQVTKYYLTARATWEKHGFYYRYLEIDRKNLSTGSVGAITWGDWRKASLPIAVDQVYGVVPAYAWNRLFLFWIELKTVTETDSNNNITTRYFLQPRVSRQNLNGSFTDPWSPTIDDGVDLEVTTLVDKAGLSSYQPAVFHPYYDMFVDQVFMHFYLHEDATAQSEEEAKVWSLDGNTSRSHIVQEKREYGSQVILGDYTSTPASVRSATKTYSVEPSFATGSAVKYEDSVGNWVTLDSYRIDFKTITTDDVVVYTLTAEGCYFHQETPGLAVTVILYVYGVDKEETGVFFIDMSNVVTMHTKPGEIFQFKEFTVAEALFSSEFLQDVEEGIMHSTISIRFSHESPEVYDDWNQNSVFRNEVYESHLMIAKDVEQRGTERYLMSEDAELGTIAVPLFSTGIQEITQKAFPGSNIRHLLALENQSPRERGVDNFLDQLDRSQYGPVKEPRPSTFLDFNGAFGIYAWELFYYIPSIIASCFRQESQFENAILWQETIFDPKGDPDARWKVRPLVEQKALSSFVISDPDRTARENPWHYQLATIRQYLQTVLDYGDTLYRQETTETLRQAKMAYIAANSLFDRESVMNLQNVTLEDWNDPALGSVAESDFRPPICREVREGNDTLVQRLSNLRGWLTIDGDPLNIPLVAPPLEPKQLMMGAAAGLPLAKVAAAAQRTLPFSFDVSLGKAKAAVENLMYLGDLLTRGLQQRDKQCYEELQAKLSRHVVENFEVGGQLSLISSMKMQLDTLKKDKEQAQKYVDWYSRFAGEFLNSFEKEGHESLRWKQSLHGLAMSQAIIQGSLMMIPNIFGLSVGGSEPEGVAYSGKEVSEHMADSHATAADIFFHKGEAQRRKEESEMERDAAKMAVQSLQLSIEQLVFDIGEEEGTLVVLKEKSSQTEALVEFQARRSTNVDFYNWYTGQAASLYNSAYDITLRFCRLAERAYQSEMGDMAKFINPVWDGRFYGLLSGQSLMIDLQRMDYAYMERYDPQSEGRVRFSLKSHDPVCLSALKNSGRVVFSLEESVLFSEDCSDEYERRIHSIAIKLVGFRDVELKQSARLTLLRHRVNYGQQQKGKSYSRQNLFGQQQIALLDSETSTVNMNNANGRFKPFERCGMDSSWLLSFPTIAKRIEKGKKVNVAKAALDDLEDVVMTVNYKARLM